ncbi:putative integral membrane protein [Streptomyces sp. EAS-AB2608]|nr:putative integral membrane protein [Streptomyces sp. EAS-AB2608]
MAAPPSRRAAGVAAMAGSGLSNQAGAAVGALAFPVLGPVGVVAVRQYVAALVLLAVARPRLRAFTWRQWWPVLLLGGVFGTMNLSLYSAVDRIGLGLAVTLEFLGPLTIALAGSRRRLDAGCAVLAGAGVVVLMRPRPSADYAGMALGLAAACCWASYILLNRVVGRRVPGAQGAAAASAVSALAFVPVGVAVAAAHPPTAGAVLCAVTAGVLSSAVPYLADLLTLRHVPAQTFGLFMSVNPVLATLAGWAVLGQGLGTAEWAGIAAVVAAKGADGWGRRVRGARRALRPAGARSARGRAVGVAPPVRVGPRRAPGGRCLSAGGALGESAGAGRAAVPGAHTGVRCRRAETGSPVPAGPPVPLCIGPPGEPGRGGDGRCPRAGGSGAR